MHDIDKFSTLIVCERALASLPVLFRYEYESAASGIGGDDDNDGG